MTLLYLSTGDRAHVWAPIFAAAGETMVIGEDAVTDPAAITHIACWTPPRDLRRYPNLRVVVSVGAGVDQIPPLPEGVALSRTIAPGIEQMVRNWVVMAALMLQRDMPLYLEQAAQGVWRGRPPGGAGDCRVGVMGMGRIGRMAAHSLAGLGFAVAGFSRSGAAVEGVEVFGPDGLSAFLARTDLLVCLLPLTAETRGMLNAGLFARLPRGARLVHAGRGAQLDMDALRDALDAGRLASAMLDVTDPEPLPPGHWAWSHPRVIVTPHVAAQTDAAQGARHVLAVIRASRAGQTVPGLVDPAVGY
jgi:glyoxylate/hydroxypyruvate reductase A